MTSVNALFPSNYLKASDFPQPRIVTINRLEMQKMNDGTEKPVLFFNELEHGLVMNKTNANRIAEFLGENYQGWPQRQVELYMEMVDFQGKRTPAIRARAPQMQHGYQHPPQGYQQPMNGPGIAPAGYPPQQPQQGYQQPSQQQPAPGAPQYYNGQGQAVQPPQGQQQQRQQPAVGVPLDDKIPF